MLVGFLLKGIVVGIVIAVPVGPVGILCIRRTILSGRLAGLSSGLGAATADSLFGIIAGFGLTVISNWLLGYQDWLKLIGAAFLLYVGGKALFTAPDVEETTQNDRDTLIRNFASTFVLTLTNPITLLSFVAIFAAVGLTGQAATVTTVGILVVGIWLGSLLWWLGLSIGAGLWRRVLDEHHLRWINRGSGGILLLCGIGLVGMVIAAHFG